MKEKKRRLSRSICRGLFLCMLSLLAGIYTYALLSIPETIRVRDGESWGSDWVRLETEETQWITVNENTIEKSTAIETTGNASVQGTVKLWGVLPLKSVSLEVWEDRELLVGGSMLGIDLYTDGILVLGTGKIETESGSVSSPAKGIVHTGDRIRKVNGVEVSSVEQVDALIAESGGEAVILELTREGTLQTVSVTPILDQNHMPRIGIWIRDRAQGLGTLTFVDPASGMFGAVGHGISDVDLETVLPVQDGLITEAKIRHLVKGEKGEPGEVEGSLTGIVSGRVTKNTDMGVYGTYQGDVSTMQSLPIALRDDITEGEAVIYSDILEDTVRAYTVQIEKTSGIPVFDTGLVVTITDERLLNATGGVIQGMSGCPLVKDGMLIGAVTHVFVNDPTRGYGVYIEDMLSQIA